MVQLFLIILIASLLLSVSAKSLSYLFDLLDDFKPWGSWANAYLITEFFFIMFLGCGLLSGGVALILYIIGG